VTRLLLVDDDEDNLKIFTIIFENAGFDVDAYSDPVRALQEFEPNYYDILVLDYRMPMLNGLDMYRRIMEIDKLAKVMLLTASHERLFSNNNQELEQNRYFRILRKPVTILKLVQEIDLILKSEQKSIAM
jgi:CheY-like chemotaxis protein